MARLIVSMFLMGVAAGAAMGQQRFSAHLNGAQEVPGNFSTAKASCQLILSAGQVQLNVTCEYSGIGSGTIAAHIHGGAVGVAGPIVFSAGGDDGESPLPVSTDPLN